MLRSMKVVVVYVALALSAISGGNALAQSREAAKALADSGEVVPSLGEAGIVLDYANRQPEFQEALKPKNTDVIRQLLIKYGLREDVPVFDFPSNTVVPPGPYTNCYTAPMTVYYPSPAYSWPNHPRVIMLLICNNSANGQTSFGW